MTEHAMKQPWAVAARVILGGIFVLAGFEHAVHPPQEFAAVMEAYLILPQSYILPFATVLPWLELFFGVFLLAGYRTRLSAAMLAAMLLVFETALVSTKVRGISLTHCGCFGAAFPLTPTQTMILDAVLLGLALAAFRWGRERWSLDRWIGQGTE